MSNNCNDTTAAAAGTTTTATSNNSVDLVSCVVSRYDLMRGNSSSGGGGGGGGGGTGGEAGIQRLLWIANKHPNPAVQQNCFRAISTICLRNGNFQRYKELFGGQQQQPLTGSSGAALQQQDDNSSYCHYNAAWVAEQEGLYRQGRDVLQHRLQAAQSQLHKEAIRTAHLALAEHDRKAGETLEAFHSLLRAKDYCTNRHQTTTVSLQIVELCLLLRNYHAAGDYIHKLEHTISTSSSTGGGATSRGGAAAAVVVAAAGTDVAPAAAPVVVDAATEVVKQKIQTAAALKDLASGEYATAAQKLAAAAISAASISATPQPMLLSLSQPQASAMASGRASSSASAPAAMMATATGVGTTPSAAALTIVLAPEDVAMYAAFLTLCCGSASDMIALAEHPEALEFVPALREALLQFAVHCNYQQCWKLLQEGEPHADASLSCFEQLQYDLYMAPHVEALQQMIRERSIAEYWKAYQRVELVDMAHDLRGIVSNVAVLKELLVNLMLRHALDKDPTTTTRLSLTSLHRDEPTQPRLEQTSDKLRIVTQNVLNDTHAMTIRLACLEHDLQVTGGTLGGPSGGGGGDGGGGGRRSRRGTRGGGGGGGSMKLDYSDEEDDDHDTPMVDAGDMNPEDLY